MADEEAGRDLRRVGNRMCAPAAEGPAADHAETSEAGASRPECRGRSLPVGHSHSLPVASSTHTFPVIAVKRLHSDGSHTPSQ